MKYKLLIGIGITIGVILLVVFLWPSTKLGLVTGGNASVVFFTATSTDATSTTAINPTNIQSAKKITFFFKRENPTATAPNVGTSTFSIQVSREATSTASLNAYWITYNKLIDNEVNSNLAGLTRVGSSTLSSSLNYGTATSTKTYSMDLTNDSYSYVRCIVSLEGTSENSCNALITY